MVALADRAWPPCSSCSSRQATIAFIAFSDLGQVGNVENRSLYGISPILWGVFVIGLLALALRFAPSRAGWALAVSASVLVSPRLLMYQLSTLQAAVRPPDDDTVGGERL